jgi:hypothetical protein
MKVTILKDGVTAKDENGNIYNIKGISLKKINGDGDIFHDKESHFFKVACPSGTYHNAFLSEKEGEIVIR